MARCSHNVVSPLQKRANDTGPNALGSAGDNDSLVWTFDYAPFIGLFFSVRIVRTGKQYLIRIDFIVIPFCYAVWFFLSQSW